MLLLLQIQRDIKQNAETQNIFFQLETGGANLIFFDSESYYYSTMFYKYQKIYIELTNTYMKYYYYFSEYNQHILETFSPFHSLTLMKQLLKKKQ